MSSRVLVTGGAGFIGSNLVDRLIAEGHEVDVIDDLSSGKLANLATARTTGQLSFHQLDIRDEAVVALIERRQPEIVFHLAAQADVRVSVERPAFDASVNILGSINVLEGARLAGSRRIVAAASGGTLYGEPSDEDIPTRETVAHQPLSPYGVSKKSMIDYLAAYRALHTMEYVALALANVYGPRQDPHGEAGVVAIFAERLLSGDPVTIFGDGSQTRDFVYVDDVVDAFVRASERSGGLVINIGTGAETSVNELYGAMAASIDVTQAAVYAPARVGEVQRSCLDVARAKMQLDWAAWTGISEGALATIEHIRTTNA